MPMRLLMLILFLSGCQSLSQANLAQNSDYLRARYNFQQGRWADARTHLPQKEDDGFIINFEREWLAFLSGSGNAELLHRKGQKLEGLQTLRISKELASKVIKADPHGYYPAEHEAVLYYMLAAMIQLREGKTEGAKVDLRRASRYLQGSYAPDRQQFDDASLRVWLAALWAAAGEWESARVDLRVAAKLDPSKPQLARWAESQNPPHRMILVLQGPGPSLKWTPLQNSSPYPFAGLEFIPSRALEADTINGSTLSLSDGFTHKNWYQFHQRKNQDLAAILGAGTYATDLVAVGSSSAVNLAAATVVAGGLIVGGVGSGVAVAVLIGDKLGAAIGLSIAATGYLAGHNLYQEAERRSDAWLAQGLGQIENYRFVRFLPDNLLFAFDSSQIESKAPADRPILSVKSPNSKTELSLYYDSAVSKALVTSRPVVRHLSNGSMSYFFHQDLLSAEAALKMCSELKVSERIPRIADISDLKYAFSTVERHPFAFPPEAIREFKDIDEVWVQVGSTPKVWSMRTQTFSEKKEARLVCVSFGPVLEQEKAL